MKLCTIIQERILGILFNITHFKACNCNKYGTEDNSADNCDPETGICNCLPKVIGRKCDECAADHWKLEGGKGCISCNCDISGTYANSTHCDQNSGQCSCIETRGGKTCDECPFNYWGTPKTGCKSIYKTSGMYMPFKLDSFYTS